MRFFSVVFALTAEAYDHGVLCRWRRLAGPRGRCGVYGTTAPHWWLPRMPGFCLGVASSKTARPGLGVPVRALTRRDSLFSRVRSAGFCQRAFYGVAAVCSWEDVLHRV